ncbi:MAG: hypothetical protein ACON5B_02200 [Myxococcota bacterium]
MTHLLRCPSCFREERTEHLDRTAERTVVQEGGSRRPLGGPERFNALAALDAVEGTTGPLMGRCEACGGVLVLHESDADHSGMTLEVPSGDARLVVQGHRSGAVVLDGQPVDVGTARAWVARTWPMHVEVPVAQQVGKSAFFLVLLGPIALWIFATVFTVAFLYTIGQGAPALFEGSPGLDVSAQPAEE